jgi:hypothetical protein
MICDKITYGTSREAIAAVDPISRRDKQNMKAYKCNQCGGFHLATEGKRKFIPRAKNGVQELKYKKNQQQPSPLPKQSKPTSFIHSKQKLLTKEQVKNLKRLIEGIGEMEKQKAL